MTDSTPADDFSAEFRSLLDAELAKFDGDLTAAAAELEVLRELLEGHRDSPTG